MLKYFVNKNQINDNKININGQDVIHIKKVLRLKITDKINISDDDGKTYECEIAKIDDNIVECNIISQINENNENIINIALFQGLAKFDKMDYIIQKATELGVNNIYPVNTKRVVVKFDDKQKEKKVQRWQQIANEAAKQCKRTMIPNVENVIFLKDICNLCYKYDIILLAYEKDEHSLKEILQSYKSINSIAVVIGPEGGFDEEELKDISMLENVHLISLGKRILRTETASISLISSILYEFNEI